MKIRPLLIALLILITASFNSTLEADSSMDTEELLKLADLSFEELLDIEVMSVSRKEQKVLSSAAAISVITNEDIRRAGSTSIAEALRMAPGIHVARSGTAGWSVSSRGFSGKFSNKLLVLIDGRAIYNPLFSGVFWEVNDVLMEDIERIEVIRGPGATLWGANAVNGVINIITRGAKQTQGTLVTVGGGSWDQAFSTIRHGAQITDNQWLKVYGKFGMRKESPLSMGGDAIDDWKMSQGGFKYDWEPSDSTTVTFQGDAYDARLGELSSNLSLANPVPTIFADHIDVSGHNLLTRWTHRYSDESDISLLAYYDHFDHDTSGFRQCRDKGHIELQYRHAFNERHEVTLGSSYSRDSDSIRGSFETDFFPKQRALDVLGGFIQDTISIKPDKLKLTLGSKFSDNDFTGFEIQPSARLAYLIDDKSTIWGSVSRAVRTPSRAEVDGRIGQSVIPGTPLSSIVAFIGSPNIESENLTAFEAGYRSKVSDRISLDIAGFYNNYTDLRSLETRLPQVETAGGIPTNVLIPIQVSNLMFGETYGGEIALSMEITDSWQLLAQYSYLEMQLHAELGSTDTTSHLDEGRSPQHQASLRSRIDLPHNWEFDTGVRYVDSLSSIAIPSYLVADIRLGWSPNETWEFSISGQNLLDSQHPEYVNEFLSREVREVEHSVYGKITWRF